MKINFFCDPFSQHHYSIEAAELLRALRVQGVDVACIPPFQLSQTHPDAAVQETIALGRRARPVCAGIRFDVPEPRRVATFSGAPRIFYTAPETDRLPPDWVAALNTVDEVWVTSAWGRSVFLESGVKRPVHVVPVGVDPSVFTIKAARAEPRKAFRFLASGALEPCQNYEALFRAYIEEFEWNEPVELLIYFGHGISTERNPYKLLFELNVGRRVPPIRFLEPVFPRDGVAARKEVAALYQTADAFILPTRGDPCGLAILEAMCCGLPVITTRIGPALEWASEETARLLDYEVVSARLARPARPADQCEDDHLGWGCWAEPSVIGLRRCMRHLFQDPAEAGEMGRRAAEEVRLRWTQRHAVAEMFRALEAAGVATG